VINLFPHVLILGSKQFDFVFSLIESSLELVFFSRDHANLMLHVSEFEHLLLKLLPAGHQLLCLLVEVTLHLIEACVEASDRRLEVEDLLVL
jgi:hypothetical protein